jgi:hypothetical protein
MQHEQHSKKFVHELNAPKNNKLNPIRESDMTWKFGKWKGWHINHVAKNYLLWAMNNMNLSDTAKSIIKKHLEERETN